MTSTSDDSSASASSRDINKRAYWDSIWTEQLDSIWEPLLHPIRTRVMAPEILNAIPNEARVYPTCEIGSGRAAASFQLAATGRGRAFALDLSLPVTRRILRDSKGRVGGVVGTAFELPFRTRSLGLSFSVSTLEHFPDPVPVLREMGRVAKHVCVAVPAASILWTGLLNTMNLAGYQGTGEFYRLYEKPLLEEHFAAAKLRMICCRKVRFLSAFPFWVATAEPESDA